MDDKTVSQVQKAEGTWKKLVAEQVARAAGLGEEMAKAEAKRVEQTTAAIDEMARMTKETLGYMTSLSAEWRKLSLEAAKRAAEMMSFGG